MNRIRARLNKPRICPFCQTEMMFRHSVISQYPLADAIYMKCPKCFFVAGFGIPIDNKTFELEKKERDGTWFSPYWKNGNDPEHLIAEKLQALGYIEYEYVKNRRNK